MDSGTLSVVIINSRKVTSLGASSVCLMSFEVCQKWNVFVVVDRYQRVTNMLDDIVTNIET